MKILTTTLGLLLLSLSVYAQFNWTSLGAGNYDYISELPEEHLHFYLFDDGYHSFGNNPSHQFPDYAYPSTVKVYHTDTYTPQEPVEAVINTVYDGVADPTIDVYEFDNMVSLKTSWNLVNEQNDYYILMFENSDPETPIVSGCVEFHYRSSDLLIEETEILDNYGNDWVHTRKHLASDYTSFNKKFKWQFEDLEYGEQRFVYIPVVCLAPTLKKVRTRAVLKFGEECDTTIPWNKQGDGSLPNNSTSQIYTLKSVVANYPHDPNCITSDIECLAFFDGTETITYRVYFQNEGEDPVVNVGLEFWVKAPYSNVKLTDSSHPCALHLNQNVTGQYFDVDDVIHILFPRIMLPGSASENPPPPSYESTIGWVEFEVCLDQWGMLQYGLNCVDTYVDIYFDWLPPVPAEHQICKPETPCHNGHANNQPIGPNLCYEPVIFSQGHIPSGSGSGTGNVGNIPSSQSDQIEEFGIHPNPGYDFIEVTGDIDETASIIITNVQGKLIQKLNRSDLLNKIDITSYRSGVYYISVITGDNKITKTFVKI